MASISYLTIQGLVNAVNIINGSIIQVIQDLNGLERANGDSQLVDAYTQKITDLKKDKDHVFSICNNMFSNFADNSGNNKNSVQINKGEGVGDS